MGRWKNDGSGNPVWDANDSGPDQIAGMPAGGPQGGQQGSQASPSPSYTPPNGNTGFSGMGPGGMTPQQPQFNPPNAWPGPDEGEKPGWGPIKINTVFNPGEGMPHPFEDWIPGNGVGKFGEDKGANSPGNGWAIGHGSVDGKPSGIADPGMFRAPFPFPGQGQGPWWAQLGGGEQIDPSRYEGQGSFDDFYRDYHAPDRDAVLRNHPGQPIYHLQNGGGMSPQGGGGLMEELLKRFQNNPDVRY